MHQFFTWVALISTAIFCVKFILLLVGSDSHAHDLDSGSSDVAGAHDTDGDHSSDSSFKILSLQVVTAFFMGFGWTGKAALEDWHIGTFGAIFSAIIFGLIAMSLYIVVMRLVFKLNNIYNPNISECVGKTGTVYMSIPSQGGRGQVEISFGGKITILDAESTTGEGIAINKIVKVESVKDRILVVKEI